MNGMKDLPEAAAAAAARPDQWKKKGIPHPEISEGEGMRKSIPYTALNGFERNSSWFCVGSFAER